MGNRKERIERATRHGKRMQETQGDRIVLKFFYRPEVGLLLLLLLITPMASGQKAGRRSNIPKPERIKIAQEARSAEIRAEQDALKKYAAPQQAKQKVKFQQELEEKYYFQICWRHKITHKQLVTIMSESLKYGLGVKH